MNRMHTLAKIMLCGIGIFFAIRLISIMVSLTWVSISEPDKQSILLVLFWTVILVSCLATVLYVFLHKLEWLAMWIIGKDEFPEPESQIQWLPVAFRLVCLAAGMYCLFTVGWSISLNLVQYIISKPKAVIEGYKTIYTARFFGIELITRWLIMLAIGIYLLCGAPHFVRWQVKKTLEQCKQPLETKEA